MLGANAIEAAVLEMLADSKSGIDTSARAELAALRLADLDTPPDTPDRISEAGDDAAAADAKRPRQAAPAPAAAVVAAAAAPNGAAAPPLPPLVAPAANAAGDAGEEAAEEPLAERRAKRSLVPSRRVTDAAASGGF